MTGKELQRIRYELCGEDYAALARFGRALGLKGTDEVVASGMRRLEAYDVVPPARAMLARIYEAFPAVRSNAGVGRRV